MAKYDDYSLWDDVLPQSKQPTTQALILADLMIPGRGEPVPDVAIGLSLDEGVITFVGPQSSLPLSMANSGLPRTHVRYILPGLWDCHTHYTGALHGDFQETSMTHPAACGAAIARGFHDTLMSGFTSVRDMGGYATEVAPMVEAGIILGPSVFGAGGAIGITGGNCDAHMLPADIVYSRQGTDTTRPWPGVSSMVLADGVDQCRLAVRQQIRRGAKCIKVVATGGTLSLNDEPIDRSYSDAELAAFVEEAGLQRRSVAMHAHGKNGIMAAIRAGAKTIEHGSFIDEEAAELMAEKGVMLVSTRYIIEDLLQRIDTLHPSIARKLLAIADSHRRAYQICVRKGVKIALGTDICVADPRSGLSPGHHGMEVVLAVKMAGLSPLQAIEAGTINSAETLGLMAPQKGLIQVGWDADLIALDENPLENISLFGEPANIKYVWKAGQLVKSPDKQLAWP